MPNISISDGTTVDYFKYDNGTDGSTVEHFRVNGGDHDWPGVWGNMDINASKEVWKFFYKHPKSSSTLGLINENETKKDIPVKIIDFMGREIKATPNSPVIHIYQD